MKMKNGKHRMYIVCYWNHYTNSGTPERRFDNIREARAYQNETNALLGYRDFDTEEEAVKWLNDRR